MKIVKSVLISGLVCLATLANTLPSQAEPSHCALTRCQGAECGCGLLKAGWKEIARCNGHQWSYLLESGSRRKLCIGIAARGGREEQPCVAFTGKLEEFRKCGK